ncbi:MAG: hypothetical protein IJ562_09250 [Prevotella sp.]|nr:hypothetical protein [Prevotella sp.]
MKIDKVVFYFNENNGNPEGSHVEKLTINCPSEHTINLTATDLTATWQSESANTGTYSFTFSDTGNSNVIINHIDVSYKPLGEDDNYTYDATVVNDGKTGKFILTGETAATLTAGSKIKDIPGIELTFGKAGDSNWSVEYNNTNYANKAKAGSTESVTLTDGVPTGGSFFVFKPLVNGFLTVDGTFYRAHNIVLTNSSGTYRQTIRETSDNYDDKYSEHSFTKVLTAGETYYLYEDGNWQFKLRGFSFTPAFILSSEDYAATEEITCYYNLSGFNVFPRLTNKKAVDGVAYTSSITSVATVEATTDNVTLKSNVGNPVISASITRGDLTLNTSYTIHNQYNESAFKVQGKSLKPSEVFDESGATNTSVNVRKQIGDIGFTFGGCDWAESYEQINTGKTSKVVSDKYSDSKDDSTGALDGFAYFMAGNNNPKDELCYNWSEGGNAVVFDQRFNIPCRGTFYKFQPKADGNLTVYVQQNGCTNTTTDSDNKVVFNPTSISYRPLYIMDEQTNFVMLIDMKTNAILPNAASDVVRENIEADVEKKYFDMIKAYWASQGLNSQAEFLKLKDDDKHNVKDSYNGEEVNVKPVTAPHLADGLILITGGMSMFKFHVQAGKTYFMFGQRTKLGISGFVFEKDAYDYSSRPTVELSQTASSFSLTDDQKAHEVKVKLSGRTIKPNVWQPICLPFSMNEQQVIDYFGEGTQVYHFDNTHDNRLHLRKHIYQYIIAGIPCFIRTTKEFKGDETVIEHVTLEKDTPTDIKGRDKDMDENKDIVDIAASEYMLKGNFTQTTINTDDEYYISNGAFYRAATQSYSLYGYRCKVVPVGGSGSAKFLSNETLFEDFMQELGEVTGINEIQSSPHGDKDAIYSLDGQKISSSAHGLDSLHKGIYIVNGKKYVVK